MFKCCVCVDLNWCYWPVDKMFDIPVVIVGHENHLSTLPCSFITTGRLTGYNASRDTHTRMKFVNHFKGRQTAVPDCETLWYLLRSVFPCRSIKSNITQYISEQYSILQDVLPLCHLEYFSLYCVKN